MKYFFTTIIATLLSLGSYAQTEFAPLGAEWTYHKVNGGSSDFGFEYLTKSFYDSSYLNDGKTIKIIRSERYTQKYQYNYFANAWQYLNRDTLSPVVDSFYEQNDTVFAYNKLWQRFTPLYIYNVQEGDTVTLPAFSDNLSVPGLLTNLTECVTQFDSTFSFRIDSIRTINYNGTDLETYFTSPVFTIDWDSTNNSNAPFYNSIYQTHKLVANWTTIANTQKTINPANPNSSDSPRLVYPIGGYIKNIGGLGGGLFPATEVIHTGLVADVVFHSINNLNCYSDSQINVQFRPQHCDSFRYNLPLSLKKLNTLNNINIYPNPVNDLLNIDIDDATKDIKIKVVNLLGNVVITATQLKPGQQTLDVNHLPAGIYLMVLESKGERFHHKFIKQ